MYTEKINANMQHLGTEIPEWSAGTAFCDKESGEVRFGIPEDYTHAKTLYNTDATCELCGHKIKHGYVITHEVKKLWMIVGSECVTHFSEKSGKQIEEEAILEVARDYYNTVLEAIRDMPMGSPEGSELRKYFKRRLYVREQPKTHYFHAWNNREQINKILTTVRRTA